SEFIIEQVFLDNQNIDARCGSLDAYLKNANHLKEIKKLKWILISISLIFVSISIPIFHFNIAYFKTFFY
ncbi:hypothetical protein, partial [Pseudoalteromonas nigrifaciens]|uniref:hypothetical protein n=1 Tax=Pseudoalteromonas nigrifaciens TaxID=28109 RepID=UPI001D01F239